eukprot:4990995-Pleurochrysis_carterae.AAC.2
MHTRRCCHFGTRRSAADGAKGCGLKLQPRFRCLAESWAAGSAAWVPSYFSPRRLHAEMLRCPGPDLSRYSSNGATRPALSSRQDRNAPARSICAPSQSNSDAFCAQERINREKYLARREAGRARRREEERQRRACAPLTPPHTRPTDA